MSVASSPPPGGGMSAAAPSPAPPREACPLCGAALHPEQEWCFRCGGAARTRLAAAPNWKGPIAALAVVVALSLGVLAAALVTLAGGSGSTAPTTATTTTVTTSPVAVTPAQTTTAQSKILPGTSSSGVTVPRSTSAPDLAGTSSSRGLTSPRTGKPNAKGLNGIGRVIEERLRKNGSLPRVGTK